MSGGQTIPPTAAMAARRDSFLRIVAERRARLAHRERRRQRLGQPDDDVTDRATEQTGQVEGIGAGVGHRGLPSWRSYVEVCPLGAGAPRGRVVLSDLDPGPGQDGLRR